MLLQSTEWRAWYVHDLAPFRTHRLLTSLQSKALSNEWSPKGINVNCIGN